MAISDTAKLAENVRDKSEAESETIEIGNLSDSPKKDKESVFEAITDKADKSSPRETDKSSPSDLPSPPITKRQKLSFGDGLAHGLPESWSIVPPDSGVIRKQPASGKTTPKIVQPATSPK